jgi:uncharacterized protein
MSAAAVIDALEFARALQELRGSLPVVSLRRLEDVLFDGEGSLEYAVRGSRDDRNRPQLELQITGGLHLQCQRCLGMLEYDVAERNTLLVVQRGADPEEDIDDPDAADTIEATPELDVAALIEEEVLLSLPLAPRHPEGTCQSRFGSMLEGAEPPKPFAELAALKRPRNPS